MAPDMRSSPTLSATCSTFMFKSALAMTFALATLSSALAVDTPPVATAFHIPPQPLGKALARFSETSGNTLLVDGLIIEGKRSAPLNGAFSPEEALIALLNGTGLEPKRLSETAFTLNRTGETATNRFDHSQPGIANPDVLAAVQTTVLATLCRSAETRPGNYGAVLHLWIDGKGRIEWLEKAQSSGNTERDTALEALLKGLKIEGLPDETPQTVTVAIQPQTAQGPILCRP